MARMEDPTKEQLEQSEPPAVNEAEEYILEVFHLDSTQERIKQLMKDTVRKELSGMSDLLRHAIRDWVKKEKAKFHSDEEEQKKVLLLEQLESYELNNKRLEAENKLMKRKLELKEHENKVMNLGIQKIMHIKK